MIFIPIQVVGENGIIESNADRKLSIKIDGGELLGFGSANPRTTESFVDGIYTTHYGNAQAIVRVHQTDMFQVMITDGDLEYSKQFPVKKD